MDIQNALFPIRICSKILLLKPFTISKAKQQFQIKNSWSYSMFQYIVLICALIFYPYAAYINFIDECFPNDDLFSLSYRIFFILNALMFMSLVLFAQVFRTTQIDFLNNLIGVEELLKKFGCGVSYRYVKRSCWSITLLLLSNTVIWIVMRLHIKQNWEFGKYEEYIVNHPYKILILVNGFRSDIQQLVTEMLPFMASIAVKLQWMVYQLILGCQFDNLNKLALQLKRKKSFSFSVVIVNGEEYLRNERLEILQVSFKFIIYFRLLSLFLFRIINL